MSIDLAVSRAIAAARALEMAVHDEGPWSLELAGMIIPVRREIDEMLMEATFTGVFPHTTGGPAVLLCRGQHVRTVGPFDPTPHAFEVRIRLSLPTEVSA
jgi:hypothetical protein